MRAWPHMEVAALLRRRFGLGMAEGALDGIVAIAQSSSVAAVSMRDFEIFRCERDRAQAEFRSALRLAGFSSSATMIRFPNLFHSEDALKSAMPTIIASRSFDFSVARTSKH